MAFIPGPSDIAKVRITWQQAGHEAQNVFHWQKDAAGAFTFVELDQLIDQVLHAYNLNTNDGPLGALADEVVMTKVETVGIGDNTSPGVERSVSLAGHNSTASPLPPALALLVGLETGFRGKSNRGRLYQIGVGDADVDDGGSVVSAALATWQTKWTNWFGGLADGAVIAGQLVIVSYFHDKLPRSLAVKQNVNSVVVRNVVATQRRRQRP